jgi:hypothetical protein
MSKANTPYYIPSNRAAAEENYGQYKSREAARMAQASQPLQYPGAMSALSMTNARVADGGDPDAAEQRRINTARAGGAGWLGLFTSGASQRALNVRRQQAIAEGHLGVEQGRLGFDTSKYFGPGGERDIAGQKVGIEGRIADIHGRQQRAEEQRYAPDTWLKNRINALYAQNRPEEAAQLQREHTGKADTVHVIPGTTGGGFAVRNLGQPDEYSRWFPGMPETTKKP